MKKLMTLLCCAAFLFAGIKGMQSGIPDVLPTQTVQATPTNVIPSLNFGHGMNYSSSPKVVRDTILVDSSRFREQVITRTPKVRQPVRVIHRTKTRWKSHVYIATPRGGEKLTLDSILKDTTNWQVHRATCISTSKNLTHFVRD